MNGFELDGKEIQKGFGLWEQFPNSELYQGISMAGSRCSARKILLFGSRARGTNRACSDIDLAVFGMPKENRGRFWHEVDELPTLLEFDIVHVTRNTDPDLLENIKKDGMLLMGKFEEKLKQLMRATDRLGEAIGDYEASSLESVRDGAIQRFEFCAELTWKTLREYLLDQGYEEINSPKAVMRRAFSIAVIEGEQDWIGLLADRNKTAHIYDEALADEIFSRIRSKYCEMFRQLIDRLRE